MSKLSVNPLIEVEQDESEEKSLQEPWKCILFNDDFHTFDEVIYQIMLATGYEETKAESIAMKAHKFGKAIVYSGEAEECIRISAVLEEIYLLTEIQG